MGAVEILHPQYHRDNLLFPTQKKSRRIPKSNPSFARSDSGKRSPTDLRRNNNKAATVVVDRPVVKELIPGQFKMLKRGEPLVDSNNPVPKADEKIENEIPTKQVEVHQNKNRKKKVEAVKVEKKSKVVGSAKVDEDIDSWSKVFAEKDRVFDDLFLSTTDRLGPGPEMVPKQIHMNNTPNNAAAVDFFAGSGFVDSPPPSSLPLPGFFTKKLQSSAIAAAVKDHRTTDLMRILNLNLL